MDTRRPTSDTERMLRSACSKVEQILVESGKMDAASSVLMENPALADDEESAIEIIYASF